MTRSQQTILILILGSLTLVSPFAIDMYLPGFPSIASDLGTSIANVQLSLTSYFVGIAVGQLLYGPLLDRFGRKPPLYFGLAVYVIASAACAFSSTVEGLIVMRFFQALGGCAGMVAAQTLVRDLFPLNRTAQAFSWITLVVAVSPMVAPTAGGYLTASFGWQSVFVTLAILSLLTLVLAWFMLPHGRRADRSISLKPKAVLKNFYGVVRNPQFLMYGISGGFVSAAPFAYIAGSADVFINTYGYTEREFGWIFALVGGVIIGFAQLNHVLLKKFKSEQIVFAGMVWQLATGGVLIGMALAGAFNGVNIVVVIILFLASHGLVNPNSTALSLAPFEKNTGSAASLLGSFRMAMGGIVTALVSVFHNHTAMPMIIGMVLCVALGFFILASGKSVVRYRSRKNLAAENPAVI